MAALRRSTPDHTRAEVTVAGAAGRDWRVNTGGNQRSIDRLFYRHELIYTGGWYPEETSPESTWRWTHQTATLAFQNPKADATFYLEYAARPDIFADAPRCLRRSLLIGRLHLRDLGRKPRVPPRYT